MCSRCGGRWARSHPYPNVAARSLRSCTGSSTIARVSQWNVVIDAKGNLTAADADSRAALGRATGHYRMHTTGGLVVLTLDEGTGAVAQTGELLVLCGDASTLPPLALMNLLGQNRETGRLVLKQGSSERVILLVNGDVASVGSNSPRDRLGAFLVRMGKIDEAELERAQVESERMGKRIGQALLARGVIDAHELWSAIQEQISELFSDVMQWSNASFALYRVAPGYKFPSTPPLSMQGLLLEAVRRADEMSLYRERIPSVTTRVRRTNRQIPESFYLDEEAALARGALQAVGVEASIADVARALHVAEFDATRACYDLVRRGLVEIVKVNADAPAHPLSLQDRHRLETYNRALREIHAEIVKAGAFERFVVGVRKFLVDPAHSFAPLFRGLAPDATGAMPIDSIAKNLGALVAAGHDPSKVIVDAFNELTFFMLFQCAELLEPDADDRLGRRVREIHAALS
jgi:hypothetical protein